MEAIIAGVLMAIGQYCAGKGADRVLESIACKRTVRQILKKDRAYIRQIFFGKKSVKGSNEENFLMDDTFQDPRFLYSGMELPERMQRELAQRYINFCAVRMNSMSSEDKVEESVKKLIFCVNYHNRLVHQYFLSNSERIIIKEISDKIDALGYAGATLDENGDYLSHNGELEYAHLQLDSIIHALRMDMKFYRLVMLIGIVGILVLVPVTIFQFSKFNYEVTTTLVATMNPLPFALLALLILTLSSLLKIQKCERTVSEYSNQLWELNFLIYKTNLLHGQVPEGMPFVTDSTHHASNT